jgi:hypothetical protein
MSDKPELPEPSAIRLWAKGDKFTRGLYEPPNRITREIWALDGDREEPLYTADQLRAYGAACAAAAMERAAVICDGLDDEALEMGYDNNADDCAAAIRAALQE